jgi:hypothetical protein
LNCVAITVQLQEEKKEEAEVNFRRPYTASEDSKKKKIHTCQFQGARFEHEARHPPAGKKKSEASGRYSAI